MHPTLDQTKTGQHRAGARFKTRTALWTLRALLALVVLTVILSAGLAGVAIFPHASSADPCDSYGDCVSASIAYIRANPDNTLYLGDQFSITIQATPGSGGTGCGSD